MHSGLVAAGIVLLVIGIIASFYSVPKTFLGYEYQKEYPYQYLGVGLVLGGIGCLIVGAVFSPKKETMTNQAQQYIPPQARLCPYCGRPLLWDSQSRRYWCEKEQKYV